MVNGNVTIKAMVRYFRTLFDKNVNINNKTNWNNNI